MSNINSIINEITKANEISKSEVVLPYSKKTIKVSKPTVKLQDDIIKLIEKYTNQKQVILQYVLLINQYVSNTVGVDVNLLDKNFYLFSSLNKLSTNSDKNYENILNDISDLSFPDTFEFSEDGIDFKFTLHIPSINIENKFIKFFSNDNDVNLLDYGFTYIFKYVKNIMLNNNEDTSIEISETNIESLYNLFQKLPLLTNTKLFEFITTNIINVINQAQKEIDIEQDPSIFVDLS